MSQETPQTIGRTDGDSGAPDTLTDEDCNSFPAGGADLLQLVRGIRAGDASFVCQLDTLVSPGVLFLLAGAVPSAELADRVHDIVVAVVRRIRDGELDAPDGLLDFVRCVTKEHIAVCLFNHKKSGDARPVVESSLCITPTRASAAGGGDSTMLMRQVLRELSARDREALERYYVLGHSEESILAGMQLTQTQFRVLKSRVKMRFLGERVRNSAPSDASGAGPKLVRT